MQPLARLRLQLTAWYAGVFTLVLALLGGGLFLTIRHQMSWHLDTSLRAAAAALERAERIREADGESAGGAVVDEVDELHIPDRSLYLLDADGQPIKPTPMADWIRDAVRRAASSGHGYGNLEAPDDRELRLYVERFTGTSGAPYVAAVVADRGELEDEYVHLIEAFAAAAVVALLLLTGGGYVLIRKSTAPVERSMEQARRFMADAAHELRTPITILRTRAEVGLAQEREPARDRAMLEAIAREAARRGGLAGDLLTLARAGGGRRRAPAWASRSPAGSPTRTARGSRSAPRRVAPPAPASPLAFPCRRISLRRNGHDHRVSRPRLRCCAARPRCHPGSGAELPRRQDVRAGRRRRLGLRRARHRGPPPVHRTPGSRDGGRSPGREGCCGDPRLESRPRDRLRVRDGSRLRDIGRRQRRHHVRSGLAPGVGAHHGRAGRRRDPVRSRHQARRHLQWGCPLRQRARPRVGEAHRHDRARWRTRVRCRVG